MIQLIINADDFGYCPERNRAIGDLFKDKSISSSTLLVNGSYASEACRLAEQIQLPLGLHWNLTEGRPIAQNRSTSLVDAQGLMHGKFGLRHKLDQGDIARDDLIEELEAQLLHYRTLTGGQMPDHLDGHQHIHVHPMVIDAVVEVMKKYRLNAIRVPADRMLQMMNERNPFYEEIVRQSEFAMKIFDQNGIRFPRYFFGMSTMGSSMTLRHVEECLEYLSNASPLIAEWMCHPGYPNDGIHGGCGQDSPPDLFSQSIDRQIEYNLLSSVQLKDLFQRFNVRLCTYDHLYASLTETG